MANDGRSGSGRGDGVGLTCDSAMPNPMHQYLALDQPELDGALIAAGLPVVSNSLLSSKNPTNESSSGSSSVQSSRTAWRLKRI